MSSLGTLYVFGTFMKPHFLLIKIAMILWLKHVMWHYRKTIGLTVGERLNSFKNSYVPGYVSMYLWMDIVLFAHNIVPELEGI